MNGFLNFLVSIARTPSILVGLVAILGLALQKKEGTDIAEGGIKTFVGFLVLTGGAGVITDALDPFGKMFMHAFHVQGVVPNNEAFTATALGKYGSATALILLVALIVNVILARMSHFKYIYLSGHVMINMSCMLAVLLAVAGFTEVPSIVIGGVFLGLFDTIMPALIQPFVRKVTHTDEIAIAHTGDFGYLISGLVAKVVGDPSKTTEDLHVPKKVSFLRDNTIAVTLTMAVAYIIVAIAAGPTYVDKFSGGINYIIYAFIESGSFAAGVYIMLAGVRMILNELIPAFKGISAKLVPGAKAGLDIPILFPFAPNAVIVGFFCSFIGGLVATALMVVFHTTIVIPGVVAHFMCGATAGVIGNAVGGRRGAVIGAFVHGFMISWVPIMLIPVLGHLGLGTASFADSDFGVVGSVVGYSGMYAGRMGIIGALVACLVIFFIISIVLDHRDKVNANANK
ncbi:PTS ascorbate transporter subunit IIC [uncultured Limosilactobacillus sp.]|uniref:PTS ascorbate transporter subunit IIC n=1 Tax=uncultured Limosilactobacillus sp. TaxID=2837629 RepID=UPI0025CD4821|nr:PTS ascorbate transporter subunit IIC [uncultured Limosilactobacillus sp.]